MNTAFERTADGKDEWLTPPDIIKALGEFDLDPCSPINNPFPIIKNTFTIDDDGLKQQWNGRVFCNPPYGTQTKIWLEKMVQHNNGIVLIFARTETKMFFDYIWNNASAIFFVKGRIKFYNVDGTPGKNPAGAPSCLIAYGENNAEILKNVDRKIIDGKFIRL